MIGQKFVVQESRYIISAADSRILKRIKDLDSHEIRSSLNTDTHTHTHNPHCLVQKLNTTRQDTEDKMSLNDFNRVSSLHRK